MTAPYVQVLRPGGGGRARRQLGRLSATLIGSAVLFAAGAVAGVLFLWGGVPVAGLFAAAYLVGALLSLRVLLVALRARAFVIGDAVDIAALTSARGSALAHGRLASGAAGLIVVVGGALSLFTADLGPVALAVLCAMPMGSLGSVARNLARRLRCLLPP